MNLHRYTDRARKDEDFAKEIESHLAHEQDAQAARGAAPDEAQRRARVRFGNPRTVREQVWRYRSLPWIDDLMRDLRFALRSLARTPGFTIVTLLVLAVGSASTRRSSRWWTRFCSSRCPIPIRRR